MRGVAETVCYGCVNYCCGKHLHLKQVNFEFVVYIISNLMMMQQDEAYCAKQVTIKFLMGKGGGQPHLPLPLDQPLNY